MPLEWQVQRGVIHEELDINGTARFHSVLARLSSMCAI